MQHFFTLWFSLLAATIFGQNIQVEGYAFEANNSGYLNEVKIKVTELESGYDMANTTSNMEGFFTFELPPIGQYVVRAEKSLFVVMYDTLTFDGTQPGTTVYMKRPMPRKPGYVFEVTMAEKRIGNEPVDAISGALVEVYNNTTKEQTLTLKNHPSPFFMTSFERGNHYTLLIRKKGFYNKRMEAHVDVDGCILCFEGVGGVNAGVADNLTSGLAAGTLLSNVTIERIDTMKATILRNILYDYNSADIRPDAAKELDNLVSMLRNNPSVMAELGSHTDSRGNDVYNAELSERRAKSAVAYILSKGIKEGRLTAKGYGESRLINGCGNDIPCDDAQHQANRRTELKIVGFGADPYEDMSLADIIRQEDMDLMLLELENQTEIRVGADGKLPDEMLRDMQQQPQGGSTSTPPNDQKPAEKPNGFRYSTDILSGGDSEAIPEKAPDATVKAIDVPKPIPAEPADPRLLTANYTGFRVQFKATKINPLLDTKTELPKFESVAIEPRPNGWWAIMAGDFKNKETAIQFLNNNVAAQFPDAYIVEYKLGKRVN